MGIVFNWITGSVAQRALVEARAVTDTTLVYVAAADSTGSFVFPNLPPGQFRVRGLLDDNNNKGLDAREAWDTATVALTDSARVEILAFAHDSVAPRLTEVVMRDSATLELLFDRALDPKQSFTPTSVDIKRSDSTVVPVLAVERAGEVRDSADVAAGPTPSRGIPSTSLIARLGVPVRQATTIRVRAAGIRSLDGVTKPTDRTARVDPTPPVTPPPAPPAGVTAPTTPTPARPTQTRPPPPPPPPPPPASPARVR
jgi:hypothetical protein